MIDVPTTFVLGAGASHPYGFPVGATLLAELQNGRFNTQLFDMGHSEKFLQDFQSALRASELTSIDSFLERSPDFLSLGKDAIAVSLVYHEHANGPAAPSGHWYRRVFNKMVAGVPNDTPQDFARMNRVSFVTFNYDRSLEHYLAKAIGNTFHLDEAQSELFASQIPIVHMYGDLGSRWQGREGYRQYDDRMTPDLIRVAAKRIQLVSEREQTPDKFVNANQLIASAHRLIFLGFGFDEVNMSRLAIGQQRQPLRGLATADHWCDVYASAKGRGPAERSFARRRLGWKAGSDQLTKIRTVTMGDEHDCESFLAHFVEGL